MSLVVPRPPDPFSPIVEVWPRGRRLCRVHNTRRGATEFNPGHGEPTRFAFFGDPTVPVLYAGGSPEAAVAESLLHDVGASDGLVPHEVYRGRQLSELAPLRDLRLVQLHSGGLLRLGVEPRELTATTAAHYGMTVEWAQAAHRAVPDADGLVWISRRWNSAPSVMLFGDRVGPAELRAVAQPLHRFDLERSFSWLAAFCRELEIDVQPPPLGQWPATLLATLTDVEE